MVRKGNIRQNLKEIEELYNAARSARKQFYYAKLAVLELCGWLEDAMDKLVERSVVRCIKVGADSALIREKVKFTFGFGYDKHFKPLLVQIIGLSRLEQVETEFDKSGKLSVFQSTLLKLKDPRNLAAHTYTTGVLPNIDAPSVVTKDLELLFSSLRELERIMKRMRY